MEHRAALTDEQHQLVLEHLPLARTAARSFAGRDRDELNAKAYEALIVLAIRFDPSIGRTFASYARSYLRRAIVDLIRDELGRHGHRRLPRWRLEFESAELDGERVQLGELIADDEPGPEEIVIAELERENSADVWQCIDRLRPRHRQVLTDLYRHGRLQLEVAADLCLTPGRISQLHTSAIRELRAVLRQHAAA